MPTGSRPTPGHELPLPPLLHESSELLDKLYTPETGLFSATAELQDAKVVNRFTPPQDAVRYTINTVAGLQRLAQHHPVAWDVTAVLDRFLDLHRHALANAGDRGLALLVLATAGRFETPEADASVDAASDGELLARSTIQEASWLLLGLLRHAECAGSESTALAARRVLAWITEQMRDPHTLFPYHSARGARRRFVSFGGIVYYLWALAESSRVLGDESAEQAFRVVTRRVLALQGRDGAWGWFYDARRAVLVDWYEIYTVHQLAMAPLFLLPAVDLEVPGARSAVHRGLGWVAGGNELQAPMLRRAPFFTYRSIRRRGARTRERRLLRGFAMAATGRSAGRAGRWGLEVNPECRSYEIGWLVYAWAGREDFPDVLRLEPMVS